MFIIIHLPSTKLLRFVFSKAENKDQIHDNFHNFLTNLFQHLLIDEFIDYESFHWQYFKLLNEISFKELENIINNVLKEYKSQLNIKPEPSFGKSTLFICTI